MRQKITPIPSETQQHFHLAIRLRFTEVMFVPLAGLLFYVL